MPGEDLNYEELSEFFKEKMVKDNDRRKRKDWMTKMPIALSLITLAVLFAVWMILEQASPETEWGFLASFGRVTFGMEPVLRSRWDTTLIYIAFIMLIVSLGTTVISVIFNKLRMKRKEDKYKKSVLIVGGITFVAFVAFLIRFVGMF